MTEVDFSFLRPGSPQHWTLNMSIPQTAVPDMHSFSGYSKDTYILPETKIFNSLTWSSLGWYTYLYRSFPDIYTCYESEIQFRQTQANVDIFNRYL